MNNTQEPFIFFGTPNVGAETLRILVDAGYRPELVVTNPDRPAGRGNKLTPSPVRVLAEELGLSVYTPERLDAAAQDYILQLKPTYAIVVAYGSILPANFIESFPKGILNIHYSLLPKYRGATPLEAALLNGDDETGVTIQKMKYELDAGDIIAGRSISVALNETAQEVRPKLITLGAELLTEILPDYLDGTSPHAAQDDDAATYCHKLQKTDGELVLDSDPMNNWYTYRAYNDTIGTYFYSGDVRVKIKSAVLMDGQFTPIRVTPAGKNEIDYTQFIANKK